MISRSCKHSKEVCTTLLLDLHCLDLSSSGKLSCRLLKTPIYPCRSLRRTIRLISYPDRSSWLLNQAKSSAGRSSCKIVELQQRPSTRGLRCRFLILRLKSSSEKIPNSQRRVPSILSIKYRTETSFVLNQVVP